MSWRSAPIKGFIETSFLDWKGCLSSVIFLGGCNFRCPFCHNRDLVLNHAKMENIPVELVMTKLRKYSQWVDRVVVTGGEPTIHTNLFTLVEKFKSRGLKVKLDTNGSNPSVVKSLINDGLIDYIAMDVKGPLHLYNRWCGVDIEEKAIRRSIDFIMEGGVDYEFRMTVVPFLHHERDVYQVASVIQKAKRFFIQEFRPQTTLDTTYNNMLPFSSDKMEKIRTVVAKMMTSCRADTVGIEETNQRIAEYYGTRIE